MTIFDRGQVLEAVELDAVVDLVEFRGEAHPPVGRVEADAAGRASPVSRPEWTSGGNRVSGAAGRTQAPRAVDAHVLRTIQMPPAVSSSPATRIIVRLSPSHSPPPTAVTTSEIETRGRA